MWYVNCQVSWEVLSEHDTHTLCSDWEVTYTDAILYWYRREKRVGRSQSTSGSNDTHAHADNPHAAPRLSDGCRPLVVIHFPPFRKWGRDLFIIIHHHSIIIIIMIVMMIAFIILIIIITISTVMAVIYLVFMAHSETVTYIVSSDSCLIQGPALSSPAAVQVGRTRGGGFLSPACSDQRLTSDRGRESGKCTRSAGRLLRSGFVTERDGWTGLNSAVSSRAGG